MILQIPVNGRKDVYGVVISLICLLTQSEAWATFAAGAPRVSFDTEPGLLVLLDRDAQTTNFGTKRFDSGTWSYDGRAAKTSSGTLRFATTSYHGTIQARHQEKDWVIQIRYKHTGAYNDDAAFYIKHEQTDRKILSLKNTGGGDNWVIQAGNSTGGWKTVSSVLHLGIEFNVFTFRYKATGDGTGTIDAFLNASKVASNITLGNGAYYVSHVQLQSTGAGEDWFDYVKVGDVRSRVGQDWVRNNRFVVTALVQTVNSIDQEEENAYADAGFTSVLVWKDYAEMYPVIRNKVQSKWQLRIPDANAFGTSMSTLDSRFAQWGTDALAVILPDEPKTVDMHKSYQFRRQVRLNQYNAGNSPPNNRPPLIWGNLKAINKSSVSNSSELYGDEQNAPAGYDYEKYVEDYFDIVDPDIISYDFYPFVRNMNDSVETEKELRDRFFRNMNIIRREALERDYPYFAFVQTFSTEKSGLTETMALPSESDLRMNVYALLAHGYKGINFFYWAASGSDSARGRGLVEVDVDGRPIPEKTHAHIKDISKEIKNLGRSLKHLRSTGVYFVRGKNTSPLTDPAYSGTNPLPAGIPAINSPQSCTGSYLTSVRATVMGTTIGAEGDLLVACFTPDEHFNGTSHQDDVYFMIVNLYRDKNKTSQQTRQDITLTFNFGTSGISGLQRLNQETGAVVQDVELVSDGGSNFHVSFDLLGGEGYLFKYDAVGDSFIGR